MSTGSLLLLVVVYLVAGCTGLRSHSDYDPSVDFSRYQTYVWSESRRLGGVSEDEPYVSPLTLNRIQQSINSDLSAKGYRLEASADAADFRVAFTIGARDRVVIDTYPASYHRTWVHHWPYYGHGTAVDAHTYTEGMLAIDMFDQQSDKPVWHGVVRKRITQIDQAQERDKIAEAVAAILESFPP